MPCLYNGNGNGNNNGNDNRHDTNKFNHRRNVDKKWKDQRTNRQLNQSFFGKNVKLTIDQQGGYSPFINPLMNDKYRNKYRIASARLQSWNYGWDAAYFVTICTKDRAHHFGEVVKGKMQLSPVGAIADVLWHEIKHHARHVELDAFVVMPNHVHGIIILNGNEADAVSSDTGFDGDGADGDGADGDGADVETGHALSLRHQYSNQTPESTPLPPPIGRDRFQNQGKNTLSSIVGSYKSAVTKHANRLGLAHGWQVRFHDHIIRDQASFDRIQAYIINNPRNWLDDKFNGK